MSSPQRRPNSPAFLAGPLLLPGTKPDEKPATACPGDDKQPSAAVATDASVFGVTRSCDMSEFADVGGSGVASESVASCSTSNLTIRRGIPLEGPAPVYGPSLPWQPFTTTMETSNAPEYGDIKSKPLSTSYLWLLVPNVLVIR